jgi:aspartate carbamoyltransferase catalytic subunit
MNHLLTSQQFSVSDIDKLFKLADECMGYINPKEGSIDMLNQLLPCNGLILATLFYEPSTRTRFSFESAMIKLGGSVLSTENASNFSSAIKGESVEDTVRTVGCYSDVIVLRHHLEGSAEIASKVSSVPIVNAGDGSGQHPTQALVDLYTIKRELQLIKWEEIDKKTITLIGDLKRSRTIHSLAYFLSKFKPKHINMVSPTELTMKPELLKHLSGTGVSWSETDDLDSVLADTDLFYQTRLQEEREKINFNEYFNYHINVDRLNKMKKDAVIMHPFPRNDEISNEVDLDPRAAYFRQIQNGLYVRMAILLLMLKGKIPYAI